MIEPLKWENDSLKILDQRKLPKEVSYFQAACMSDCIFAIRDMITRGAPCIGFTGIMGMAFGCKEMGIVTLNQAHKISKLIIDARPTAVNLQFEAERCLEIIKDELKDENSGDFFFKLLLNFAFSQIEASQRNHEDMATLAINYAIEKFGSHKKLRVLTHCNTGFLACGSLGTALGFISQANKKGMIEHVYADETRPYLQGSRLTAFELDQENIPFDIIIEGAWSYLFSQGLVDLIVVGADRIAKNGDTANKIGTASLAVIAKHYNIPLWVLAPTSSFDKKIASGEEIEIEMRNSSEVCADFPSLNPSFDITKSEFIDRIFSEKEMINPRNPN